MSSTPDHPHQPDDGGPDHPSYASGDEGYRRVDPITGDGPVFGRKRAAVERFCTELADTIGNLDRQLVDISQRRRQLALQLKQQRKRLHLNLFQPGRAPGPDGSVQLPPVPHNAQYLWGRRLRSACRAVLARLGQATLTELHAVLHHLGYALASRTPVKALADALGYDTDAGNLQRVERGTYAYPRDQRKPTRLWRGGPPIGPLPAS